VRSCNRAAACPPATSTAGLNEVVPAGCGWPAGCGAEASFHFIHAEDIARRLRESDPCSPTNPNTEPGAGPLRRLVLGQPGGQRGHTSVASAAGAGCPAPRLACPSPSAAGLIEALIKVLPIEVNAWGSGFSIRQRHFRAMSPIKHHRSASGLVSLAPSLELAF